MFLQLRPIAGIVAIAVTLPLLATGGIFSSARNVAVPTFVVAAIVWTALFYWLRTARNSGRGTYVLCGVALGVLPWAFFYVVSIIFEETPPPVAMLGIGLATGALAGLALRNLTPFEREHG